MRGFPWSLVGLCLWGWLWDQLPQNRIPPNVLIYHVQPRVPLTLHTLSPGFQKSSEFYWPDAVQIDFSAYYFFYLHTYLLERFTAEPEERGEAERNTWNPGAPSVPTHGVSSSST